MVISSLFVVYVILKNKELRNTNNLLIVNLLITDVISTVIICCITVPLIIAYLTDWDLYLDCDVMVPLVRWLSMSTRLMILPPAVHRFVCVARPFTHHRILTKRRIVLMIIALWAFPAIIRFVPQVGNIHMVYIPSLGSCAVVSNGQELRVLLSVISYILSVLLTVISVVYLHHKIIHVKAYIRDLQRSGLDRSKLTKSQRLKELLTEQVKPTIGVFVVGGMDAVFNLLIAIVVAFSVALTTPIARFLIFQTVITVLFYLQSLSHSLSYGLWNKNIRDKIFAWYPKRSRVIMLDRQ